MVLTEDYEILLKIQQITGMGFMTWKLGTNEIQWSPEVFRLYGVAPETTPTLESTVGLVHPDDLDFVRESLDTAVQTGEKYNIEHRIVRPDGRIIWVHAQAEILYDRDGNAEELLGTVLDITDRKHSEAALLESEQRYRAVVECQTELISRFLPDTTLTFVNGPLCRLTGLPAGELTGKPFLDFVDPDYQQEILAMIKSLSPESPTVSNEQHTILPDGSERWMLWNNTAICDEKGRIVEYQGVGRDITERKNFEKALAYSENRFRSIAENAIDCIFIKNRNREYTFVNRAMQTLLKLPEDEILGKRPEELFGPEQGNTVRELDDRNFSGETVNETRYLEIAGKQFFSNTIQAPLTVVNGEVTSIMGIVRDVTEHRQLEEQLRQSEKMRAIGQLAGGIAHDFNNQLTGVLCFADMLVSRLKDPDLNRYAVNVTKAAMRAAELTRQLLSFSRKGKNFSLPVQVHGVVSDVITILEHSIDKRIKIRQLLKASPATTIGDANQIQNAILNIALNARDAMPEGGEITFETDVAELDESFCRSHPHDILPGNYLVVSVADNGCGMTSDTQKRIFEPFYTTKDVGKGTGMGLASVYGTIRSHKGAICVHSEPGQGTTFQIYLPLVEDTAEEQEEGDGGASVTGEARILLVDDEEIVRETAGEVLRGLGHTVILRNNGRDAVEYYEKSWKEIDLVILDIVMPELGGIDAFAAMRAINPDVKVILSSGYSLNDESQTAIADGAMAFVGKPFNQIELSENVAQVLQKRTTQQEKGDFRK